MIEQAKKDALKHGFADRTTFCALSAEDCASAVSEAGLSQVDAITVATAAHWFDMPAFYASAAKVLRPGGTLAMWVPVSLYCHPSVSKHKEVQAILDGLEEGFLSPYMQAGSMLARTGYETLPLPWSIPDTHGLFDEAAFKRCEWDRDGVPSAPPLPDGTPGPFLFERKMTIAQGEAAWATSSPSNGCLS
ncbi:hypothetical protein BAUCODRAFT_30789 [Baudoinia panamericana UAMH 10762]|uniref:Methyltransferase type 11 domain-containing protein n=1 Tax=Baudoinia panamericana (strain UAMH 10762) TaxID=717646 RepID=M2NLE1_BAUPA|nr:uncharacterized protein BAUCODRAFT_30789 [Baudoinia panamericana UAMH 10762]EMD00305.1 hypothetical protein BAUCODRAFT_30789 [Baudoinia panamericana UAMH 10762]